MGPLTPRKRGNFRGGTPSQTWNCKLQPNRQSYAATWWIQTRSWMDLPQRFRLLPNYFGRCCIFYTNPSLPICCIIIINQKVLCSIAADFSSQSELIDSVTGHSTSSKLRWFVHYRLNLIMNLRLVKTRCVLLFKTQLWRKPYLANQKHKA